MLSKEQLLKELDEAVEDYSDWVSHQWSLDGDDEDVFYIISIRDDIHKIVDALTRRRIKFNRNEISTLDAMWQKHISSGKDLRQFRYDFNARPERSKWWWWIDRLDELTTEEKGTI